MKKEIGKYLAILLGCICIILTIILIYVKTSTVNAQTDTKNLNSKIKEELRYLDSNIIKVMNKLNNITVINYKVYTREINEPSNNQQSNNNQESSQGGSQSSQGSGEGQSNSGQTISISELVPNTVLGNNNSEIDWNETAYLLENIYSTWPTINLDLKKQGLSDEMINSFSVSLSGAVQSLKNKDKNNVLINLYNMYINIPKYMSAISDDLKDISLFETKTNILNAYVLASTGDKWNDITNAVTSAKDSFSAILSNENDENKKADLEKTYVIIEDLERISKINDKDIFFMGYKNVLQQLETTK